MHRSIIQGIATGLLLLLDVAPAIAQTAPPFDPFPGGSAASYHFNFRRTLFSSDAVAQADRERLLRELDSLGVRVQRLDGTPDALLAALRMADSVDRRLQRHYAWLSLRSAVDTRDTAAGRLLNSLSARGNPPFGLLNAHLLAIDSARWAGFVRTTPALARYTFAYQRLRRQSTTPVGAPAATIDSLQRMAFTWGPQLFWSTVNGTDFGKVQTPDGQLDVRTQPNEITSHTSRAVREAGMRANWAGIAAHQDTYAEILTKTADARHRLSRLTGFRSHQEESYAAGYLTPRDVRVMLSALAQSAGENRAYERLRADRIEHVLGVKRAAPWDLTAPLTRAPAPRFTAPEASAAILAAVRPFGTRYQNQMAALLDPANGRLDIAPGPYRTNRPGFSTGLVGFPSFFYQGRFEGFIPDVIILAHEAGHAVQNMLMDESGVLTRYASGPSYFTESYALFNEFLVLEHLVRTTKDTSARIYFLERLLDQGTDLYRNGFEALFEDRLYDSVAVGRLLNATELERLAQRTGSAFSIWYGDSSQQRLPWTRPLQFYTRPLYRVNYVYAKLLAFEYYVRLRRDSATFVQKYVALLSHGYDAPPARLLQEHLGIDITTPTALVSNAADVIRGWREELAKLYRQ